MKAFQLAHPDYTAYVSEHFHMSEFPGEAIDGLHGLISRDCSDLEGMVNLIRGHIPESPTSNWSENYLESDLRQAIRGILNRPFHKFMNALAAVAERLDHTSFQIDLEELLAEHRFGYQLKGSHGNLEWVTRENVGISTASLDGAQAVLLDVFEQAMAHLDQAQENFKRGDDRSRKDAIRDAMSAMESLYKQLSGADDIDKAWKILRDQGTWGPSEIVKDGLSIWNHLHYLHPDIRHGQATATDLPEAEAYYWIDRIVSFVKYMSRKHE